MEQQNLSLAQYLFGIVLAVAIFIIKDAITTAKSGFLFRRRVAADIKLLVENYREHLPTLTSQLEGLASAIEDRQAGISTNIPVAMIWDNQFSLLDDLYKNSMHLNLNTFREVVNFYDIVGSIDEVRKAYNENVQELIKTDTRNIFSLIFLQNCLNDMQAIYLDLIERGCNALILIAQTHWFLKIDVAHYRNILATKK